MTNTFLEDDIMADEINQQAAPAPEAPASEQAATPEAPKTYDQKYVDQLRNEAAGYRVQLREAQEALGKAVTPEQFAKVQEDLAAANKRALKADHTSGLPKEIVEAGWVTWPDDEDGIKKVASELRALVAAQHAQQEAVATGGDQLAGGLDPNTSGQEQNLDPAYLASKARTFRNR